MGFHIFDDRSDVGRLVEKGERVRVIDNLTTGKRENLELCIDEIEFIQGDLRDPKAADQA